MQTKCINHSCKRRYRSPAADSSRVKYDAFEMAYFPLGDRTVVVEMPLYAEKWIRRSGNWSEIDSVTTVNFRPKMDADKALVRHLVFFYQRNARGRAGAQEWDPKRNIRGNLRRPLEVRHLIPIRWITIS